MKKYKCIAERRWELDLVRWEGKVIDLNAKVYKTGIIRTTKEQALQDAERLAEELQTGITGR